MADLAKRAVAMARAVPEDPWCGIADPDQLATSWPALDLVDPREPTAEHLLDLCREAEDAARAVKGVTNSEGADAGWSRCHVAIVASNGFAGAYERGGYSLSASVIAGKDTGMERDYEWTSAVYEKDMMDAAKVGRTAGKRAVARLNPQSAEERQGAGGVRPARVGRHAGPSDRRHQRQGASRAAPRS